MSAGSNPASEANIKNNTAMSDYTLRNTSIPSSKAVFIEKGDEMVLYIKPNNIDPLKYKELQEVIIKFLNNGKN